MEEKMPFAEWLNSLVNDEVIPIAPLFRLSDMDPEEWLEFHAFWPTIDDERRRIITRHLADLSEESFEVDFSEFFSMGLTDSSSDVRMAALDGLWDAEDVALIKPIINMMKSDPDKGVRAKAALSLGHFIVLGEWEIISTKAVIPIVSALLQQLESSETAEVVRNSALESFGYAYHPRVPELIKSAYESGRFQVQVSAMGAMGNSADGQWIPYVLEEFEHPDAEMRFMAARAAGQIGSSDFVDRLIELTDDEDMEVQIMAIGSLGEIGGDVAQEALERLAEDPELDEALLEAVEEAIEEMSMMSGFGDLSLLDFKEDDEFEDEEDGNWLPFNGEA